MINFKKAQKSHKGNVFKLLVLFFIACALLVTLVTAVAMFFLTSNTNYAYSNEVRDEAFMVGGGVLLAVIMGTLYQYFNLKGGGKVVAIDLGAKELSSQTKDKYEKRFLNIIEEISIASNTPIPTAYILEDESINAFVSGINTDDIIICATKGAITKLNREELQGVVAHEFSHIFHEDVKLNVTVSSLIFGLFTLAIIGRFLLHTTQSRSSSRDDKGKGAIMIIGLALFIAGYAGKLIGSIINMAISRQKEYLADASAVKYTRNPTGIANALKKIGSYSSFLSSSKAELYNHFYLADGSDGFKLSAIFATHPPLKKRIYALEPNWDGNFLTHKEQKTKETKKKKDTKDIKDNLTKILTTASVLNELNNYEYPKTKHIQSAKEDMSFISAKLKSISQEPLGAQSLILALLARDYKEVSNLQLTNLKKNNPKLHRLVLIASNHLLDLKEENYLSLILLCTSSLKQMSIHQYLDFKKLLNEWIFENGQVVFFEWLIQRIVLYPLNAHFNIHPQNTQKATKDQVEFFISFLSLMEDNDNPKALFDKIMNQSGFYDYNFTENLSKDYIKLGEALDAISALDCNTKNAILKASLLSLNEDKVLDAKNRQMLYAISLALKVPLPYM